MAVISMISTIECDECGVHFQVEHDLAYSPAAEWSLHDIAEDRVRGGLVKGKSLFDGSCSAQGGKMLCIPCTDAADSQDESA